MRVEERNGKMKHRADFTLKSETKRRIIEKDEQDEG